MRFRADAPQTTRLRGPALAVVAACILSACATGRSGPVAVREGSDFVLREDVRVGGGVRSDFEDAVDLLEEERYEQAIALLEGVVGNAPEVTSAHVDLGMAYNRTDDLERAEASLQRALELSPRHPAALNELGIVFRRTGRFDEARESYERALSVHPAFHFARRNLAILCDLYLEDLECALEHYQRHAEAFPEDETLAMWIADIRIRLGR